MKEAFVMRYMALRGGSELQMAKMSEQLSSQVSIDWWTTEINFSSFPNLKNSNLHLAGNDFKWLKFFLLPIHYLIYEVAVVNLSIPDFSTLEFPNILCSVMESECS